MKYIKSFYIDRDGKRFTIKLYRTNSPSNYNLWVSVHQVGQKNPLIGTTLRSDTNNDRIIEWANCVLNYPDMEQYFINEPAYAMKIHYTDKEIEKWINRTDSDLSIETWETFFPGDQDNIRFDLFYHRYQKRHIQKYGHKLLITTE